MSKLQEYLEAHPPETRTVVGYFVQGDKVLLGLRKHTDGLGQNLIAGIGGKVGDLTGLEHETPKQAFEREVREEIGNVELVRYHVAGEVDYLIPHKPKWSQKVTIFLVDEWEGEPQETDAIKPVWFRQNQLPESQMWPDNLITIPLVLARKATRGTFLYNEEGVEEYELEEIGAIPR